AGEPPTTLIERRWAAEFFINAPIGAPTQGVATAMTIDATRLLCWIQEREAIRLRRAVGQPRAEWTADPILREWSFCNVRREHDRITRWIALNWREPHADDQDLFFAMAVARFINWPDSLAAVGYPVPWNRDHFI